MTMLLSSAVAQSQCDAFVDAIDIGASVSKLRIYTASRPANPSLTATGTLLIEFALPDPCFGSAAIAGSNAVATANAITPINAVASGTAAWARVIDGNGAAVADCDVSASAGSGDVKLSNTSVVVGVESSVVSWTVSLAKGW